MRPLVLSLSLFRLIKVVIRVCVFHPGGRAERRACFVLAVAHARCGTSRKRQFGIRDRGPAQDQARSETLELLSQISVQLNGIL